MAKKTENKQQTTQHRRSVFSRVSIVDLLAFHFLVRELAHAFTLGDDFQGSLFLEGSFLLAPAAGRILANPIKYTTFATLKFNIN